MLNYARSGRGFWFGCGLGAAIILLAGLLWQGLGSPPAALAQVPDSGQQRNEMIKELRISNEKLTEIADLLRQIRDVQVGGKKDEKPAPVKP